MIKFADRISQIRARLRFRIRMRAQLQELEVDHEINDGKLEQAVRVCIRSVLPDTLVWRVLSNGVSEVVRCDGLHGWGWFVSVSAATGVLDGDSLGAL